MYEWSLEQLYIKDVEDFKKKFTLYLENCKINKEIPIIQNFACFLGTSTKTLRNMHELEEFKALEAFKHITDPEELNNCFIIFLRIINILENKLSQQLLSSRNQVGAIFLLKNDYNYQDKQEIEATTKVYTVDIID